MPAALLGALRCRRCGVEVTPEQACDRCGAAWAPALAGSAGRDGRTPLTGVVTASVGRRWAAHLLDLALLLVLGALSAMIAAGELAGPWPWWLPAAAAAVILVTQIGFLATRGGTVGRSLLRQRTVDDLTGTPIGLGRALAALRPAGPRHRLVTADLRRGRDPWRLRLEPSASQPGSTAQREVQTTPQTVTSTSVPATAGASAGPSVGIVLDTGERYEITSTLLVGRSPVDASGADRPLLAWPDLTRRLAKTHALLEWTGTVLWVTDLGSTTGTSVLTPGGDRQLVAPAVRSAATVGSTIECGGRSMKVVPGG